LTARTDRLKELTNKHLIDCDINILSHRIYYDKNKGHKLLQLVSDIYKNVSKIIFVDDLKSNIIDVQNSFLNTRFDINLYHIDHYS
jgi:hypothetical protein